MANDNKNKFTIKNKTYVKKNEPVKKLNDGNKLKRQKEIVTWVLGHDQDMLNMSDFDELDDSYLDRIETIHSSDEQSDEELNSKNKKTSTTTPQNTKSNNTTKPTQTDTKSKNSKTSEIFSSFINGKKEASVPNSKNLKSKEEENKEQKIKKKEKIQSTGFKFESISNGMSRAVPGILQQNITIERTFFNDLLKLSRQRYKAKLNLEFKKKSFITTQEAKNLVVNPSEKMGDKKSPSSEFSTSLLKTPYQTKSKIKVKENNSPSPILIRKVESAKPKYDPKVNKKRYVKSSSAFDMREPDRMDSLLSPKQSTKTKIKKHVRFSPSSSRKSSIDIQLDSDSEEDKFQDSMPLKPEIKRPHTSIAIMSHKDYPLDDFDLINDLEEDEEEDYEEEKEANKKSNSIKNPMNDERYKTLLNSFDNVYKSDKSGFSEKEKCPVELIRQIINSNKALQCPKQNKNENIDKNLLKFDSMKYRFFDENSYYNY